MSARLLAGAAVLVLTLAACGGKAGDPGQGPQAGKIPVVASTNVWGSVLRAVGGDAVDVKSVIDDPAADPHGYQSTPTDAIDLRNAKLALYNGAGYDDFFTQLVRENGQNVPTIVAFDLSGKKPGGNEHVWYDFPTVKRVADKIAEQLGTVAPDKKDTFAANAKAFDGRLDELIAKARSIGQAKPGVLVVVTEPVPVYLLETAGVKDVTPEEFSKAIEEETDPPATAVAATTDLLKNKQVAALINNEQTETPVTKQLRSVAAAAGLPVVGVTETLPDGAGDYLDWMAKQVDALSAAVKR
ncbi:metal ABC transporter solute-binding protein, Zn/Mn family [Actinocrispum wychmicini]|uniref:Zinc/manganese transport system substrate-binding protein n=1 Tax=Actinocrispum wychmicini TaxID=1213861 RepID=A0A4R2JMY5_9PSEU|nr:zinc ABC transporter substrate-binding protein [Actinocrispum wychmicini]TCO58019.1 zinc/manganese transport system substrate-binding protein [Actinocrispum wychmicini]